MKTETVPLEKIADLICDALWVECIRQREPLNQADAMYLKGRREMTLDFSRRLNPLFPPVPRRRLTLAIDNTTRKIDQKGG